MKKPTQTEVKKGTKPLELNKVTKGGESNHSSFRGTDSVLSIIPTFPMLCPTCFSSIEIQSINLDKNVYYISFICQNGHEVKNKNLIDFLKEKPKETKELLLCDEHEEKFVAYCTKCEQNLCLECALEDEHKDEPGVILHFPELFPGKKEMKHYVDLKAKELDILQEAKENVFEWIDELKDKVENLFKNQETLIQFQKNYVQNMILSSVNYSKGKSINYLMHDLLYHRNLQSIVGDKFEENFSPIESQIFDIIGIHKIPEKNESLEEIESIVSRTPSVFDFKNMKSNIIKKEDDFKTLIGFFEKAPKGMKKLYTATESDGSAQDFHEQCDKKGPTITIVKSSNGYVYGGYTQKKWGVEGHQDDPNSFLFSMNKKKKFDAIEGNGINSDPSNGPTFEGEEFIVMQLTDECLSNKTSLTKYSDDHDYNDAILQSERKIGEHCYTKITEYEVYQVLN